MARPKAIVPVAVDQEFINICVYGEPGIGKTVMLGTSPNALILEADPRGTVSAAVQGSKAKKWKVRTHEDLAEVHEYLRHGGTDDFEWVWFDSITLFQDYSLLEIMENLHASKPHRQVWAPDRGEYRENMTRLLHFIKYMVDLPINFGCTAHMMEVEDENGKHVIMPAIQGINMPTKVCGHMNMVAYMYARTKEGGKTERVLRLRKDAKHYAKDHFDCVPNGRLVNPTIPDLAALAQARMPGRSVSRKRGGTVRRTAARSTKKTTKKTTRTRRTAK